MLAAYFCFASLSLYVLAFLLYLHDRHSPELRGTAMLIFSMGAVALAFASLLWMEVRFAAQTASQALAHSEAEAQRMAQGTGSKAERGPQTVMTLSPPPAL